MYSVEPSVISCINLNFVSLIFFDNFWSISPAVAHQMRLCVESGSGDPSTYVENPLGNLKVYHLWLVQKLGNMVANVMSLANLHALPGVVGAAIVLVWALAVLVSVLMPMLACLGYTTYLKAQLFQTVLAEAPQAVLSVQSLSVMLSQGQTIDLALFVSCVLAYLGLLQGLGVVVPVLDQPAHGREASNHYMRLDTSP